MGIDDSSKVFNTDVLRLELSRPKQPHLTLVDLPRDSKAVLLCIKSPRSIIIAVVSAENDFNNQPTTKYCERQGCR